MTFKLAPLSVTIGTATTMLKTTPLIDADMVQRAFPAADMVRADFNPRLKYSDGTIYLLCDEEPLNDLGDGIDPESQSSGLYTLSMSFGVWRIGGFKGNKFVNELEEYIMSFHITATEEELSW